MPHHVTSNHKMHTKKRAATSSRHVFAAAGAGLVLAAASSHAESPMSFSPDNIYAGADAGGAFQEDISIRNNTGFSGGGGKIKFESGWNAGGFAGYKFCDYFSAEIDSGVIWNNITVIGIQSLAGVASAHLEEVPVMANGIFTFPLGNFKPYVGVGLGGAFGIFNGQNFQSLGGPSTYRSTDLTLMAQIQVGASYSFCKNLDLGVEYRFAGTGDHFWESNGITLTTRGTMTHMVDARLTWHF